MKTLGDRFADAGLRGEKLHLQEEARFLLDLKGDARAALAAASENYRTQREPRDAQRADRRSASPRAIRPLPHRQCNGSIRAASKARASGMRR